VDGVFFAEPAILLPFQPIRRVLLFFFGVVVALLAVGASEDNLDSHGCASLTIAVFELPSSKRGGCRYKERTKKNPAPEVGSL
jgi:hypothetical protein